MSKAKRTQDIVREMMDLGTVLVRLCVVGEDVIAAAVARQQETKQKIGETLVAMGAITEEQLTEALALQVRLRATGNNIEAMAELLDQAQTSLLERMRRISAR